MSNTTVGNVYQQIIKDVIEASRVDFEEGGVDEGVLEELSKGWQRKLTALAVAQFPWDPKLEANPTSTQNMQQNGNYQNQTIKTPPNESGSSITIPNLPQSINLPRIKTEPGLENVGSNAPPFQAVPAGMSAQQRAAHNLQQNFGARAAASINAIQSAVPGPQGQQTQQPQQQQRSNPPTAQRPSQGNMTQAQYQQAMATQAAFMKAQIPNQNGAGNAQTDGASDPEHFGVLSRVNQQGEVVELARVEIDNLIRTKIESLGTAMEGGGLMMPLRKHITSRANKKRKVKVTSASVANEGDNALSVLRAVQMDGGDDDDDDDDEKLKAEDDLDVDAINSDLDDPDDGLNDDEDDDEGGNMMLCMYDKVQRVKNKWKCVMKDGVVTINGQDYVLHKASGEFEW